MGGGKAARGRHAAPLRGAGDVAGPAAARVDDKHQRGKKWPAEVVATAIRLLQAGTAVAEVARLTSMSLSSIQRAWRLHQAKGVVQERSPAREAAGAGSRSLGEAGLAFLGQLSAVKPKAYLREYVQWMRQGGFIVSEGTVCAALADMKLTLKKV